MKALSTDQQLPPTARRHSPRHRALLTLSGVLAIGVIAAACGSSTKTSSVPPATSGAAATTAAVDTATNANLGKILVDSKGFTLYRLNKDSVNKSTCDTACVQIWPRLFQTGSGSPVGGSGVTGLGTINVAGGKQVTYQGMPLYTYTGDSSPGQVNGQNFTDVWGTWFVIVAQAPAAGSATTTPASPTTKAPPTTAGGGGGPAF